MWNGNRTRSVKRSLLGFFWSVLYDIRSLSRKICYDSQVPIKVVYITGVLGDNCLRTLRQKSWCTVAWVYDLALGWLRWVKTQWTWLRFEPGQFDPSSSGLTKTTCLLKSPMEFQGFHEMFSARRQLVFTGMPNFLNWIIRKTSSWWSHQAGKFISQPVSFPDVQLGVSLVAVHWADDCRWGWSACFVCPSRGKFFYKEVEFKNFISHKIYIFLNS